jgi:hypothetical protein
MRTFGLNSQEFYDFVSPAPDPNGWGPRLPREPRFPREPDYVAVIADDEAEARDAFKDWVQHVEAGRIG